METIVTIGLSPEHSINAYDLLEKLNRHIVFPSGRVMPIKHETRSSFLSKERTMEYIINQLTDDTTKFLTQMFDEYGYYIQHCGAPLEEVKMYLVEQYVGAWIDDIDLNLEGAFHYKELSEQRYAERQAEYLAKHPEEAEKSDETFDCEDFDPELETFSQYRRRKLKEMKELKKQNKNKEKEQS